jgi:hypothetical protein
MAVLLTAVLCASAHESLAAEPTRFTVSVTGQGPDIT